MKFFYRLFLLSGRREVEERRNKLFCDTWMTFYYLIPVRVCSTFYSMIKSNQGEVFFHSSYPDVPLRNSINRNNNHKSKNNKTRRNTNQSIKKYINRTKWNTYTDRHRYEWNRRRNSKNNNEQNPTGGNMVCSKCTNNKQNNTRKLSTRKPRHNQR